MARAVALAERGRRTAPPNPWVGCVVVRAGRPVGEGFHRAAGEPHAEAHALRAAGEAARGATAYVTLEPCSHVGRTPPCADALIAAGVTRVVIALLDPDPRVSGLGAERLRASGLRVDVGAGAAAASAALAPYLHQRRTGRAYCLLKVAASLDGRTAAADGTSHWITGSAARADVHRLRAASQAVVVGAGTALADRPALTARDVEPAVERQPLRVLLDARGRVPADGPLFDRSLAPTLVLTTDAAPGARCEEWQAAGAEVLNLPAGPSGVDLEAVLRALARRGVLQALVEGGPLLAGALVRAKLVDRLVVYLGPLLLGSEGRPLVAGPGPTTLDQAWRWRLVEVARWGEDLRLDYEPIHPGAVG